MPDLPPRRTPLESRRACLAAGAAGLLAPAAVLAARPLRYARFSVTEHDPKVYFPLTLLRQMLTQAGMELTPAPTELVMDRPRAIKALMEGQIDITWGALNTEAEARLRPIRIPIFRGLLGQRVFLIRKDRQESFAAVKTLSDLSALTAGQGIGWVDVPILKAAGLTVVSNTYDALFKSLVRGTIDYFPRAAPEAVGELQAMGAQYPELMLEPRLLLSYRSDLIFYLRREDEALAAQLEAALRRLHDSGTFGRMFEGDPYVRAGLRVAQLERRVRFAIPNPMLSDEDRAIPDRFWGL
jgi:ABC-type amino acid transport substrate-binding protein